ncbi:MAG: GNAT family N-acetyltransferase [Paraprevotella sp.]|nr:GNAT family N-acetyltransferase [Paraprevotella sp.]
METREYIPEDIHEIIKLFHDTVHSVNARDYTKEQLNAWANGDIDIESWNMSLQEHFCIVATENGKITGFGDISRNGYLNRLFVHRDFQGQGIATAICERLEKLISGKITTHASITAKPFFEKRGYCTVRSQRVERHGVWLTNFVMEKDTTGDS